MGYRFLLGYAFVRLESEQNSSLLARIYMARDMIARVV
jgi:hypothetical protein